MGKRRKRSNKQRPIEVQVHKMAKAIAKQFNHHIRSIKTKERYESSLRGVARSMLPKGLNLRTMTLADAVEYLEQRALTLSQSTVDSDRKALNALFRLVTKKLGSDERLPVIKALRETIYKTRAYTRAQVALILSIIKPLHVLSTLIALEAGLRGHELFTLNRPELQPAHRRNHKDPMELRKLKFDRRDGVIYTVKGKGGLIREVLIPHELAALLEQCRLDTPKHVTDGRIHYRQHYDISAGTKWARAFSRASKKALGWSNGAHGLRHTYAQERFSELASSAWLDRRHQEIASAKSLKIVDAAALYRKMRLTIVSHEMGHFRWQITDTYLR